MTESLRGLLVANKKLVDVIGYLNNTTSVIEFLKVTNIASKCNAMLIDQQELRKIQR